MAEQRRITAVIDTNLLVRYLTEDDTAKAKAVDDLLARAEQGRERLLVPSVVVAELVWVLESYYQMRSNQVVELVEAMLSTPGLEVQDAPLIRAALVTYVAGDVDFIDAWIMEFARLRKVDRVYTFDKRHFKEIKGLKVVQP
jgi:uncharacterized protein